MVTMNVHKMQKKKYNSLMIITFLFFLFSYSFVLAADSSEKSRQLTKTDLKLSLMYPKSPFDNIITNYATECKFTKFSFNNESKKAKSKGKAFLFSLLLPGAGEYYTGHKTLAKSFIITEIVLWAGYFSFKAYSKWKRDDMYIFAASHADAKVEGKPSQFFVDIGNYHDVYEYNDAKQRRREFSKVYMEKDYYWSWDSVDNQQEFELMRISSDRAYNRAVFTIGGIIANHVISAIDAVWHSYIYNKRINKSATNIDEVKIHVSGMKQLLITIQKPL